MNRDRGTEVERRSFKWVALVALGLAGVVAVTAATALAARSPASPFELVLQGREEFVTDRDVYVGSQFVGTFTSAAPFCESGTASGPVDADGDYLPDPRDTFERYTCTDGSGSLTLRLANRPAGILGNPGGDWTIVEGSGVYADLRGKGTFSVEAEMPDEELLTFPFRATYHGFADADAVAPSLAFTSASATKLRRPAGAYSIRLVLALRDDVEGNPVAYRLMLKEGPEHPRDRQLWWIDTREGSTASGSVSMKVRVFPSSKRVRSVELRLTGSDPVGNEVSITRWVKLPR
jgi:hypothetical protein